MRREGTKRERALSSPPLLYLTSPFCLVRFAAQHDIAERRHEWRSEEGCCVGQGRSVGRIACAQSALWPAILVLLRLVDFYGAQGCSLIHPRSLLGPRFMTCYISISVRKYSLDWSWSWQEVIKRPLCKFMIVIEFEHFMNILLTAYKHLCVC